MLTKLDEIDIVYFSCNILLDFYRMLITTTNLFANISPKGYPILALFVLIDRTTCQLTKKVVIAFFGY